MFGATGRYLAGTIVVVASAGCTHAQGSSVAVPTACTNSLHMSDNVACFPPSKLGEAEQGLPFAPVDPRPLVNRYAHLRLLEVRIARMGIRPNSGNTYPAGPPLWIWYFFGRSFARVRRSGSGAGSLSIRDERA